MEKYGLIVEEIRNWVWGAPLLFLLLGTGAYLTLILRGVQFRYLGYAIVQVFAHRRKGAVGDISHFEALMTTLAGAIGTGAIVGVTSAVMVGGLGSLFWMWITALLGMATKYAESLLAVKYRDIDKRGEMIGGPMEYMEKGLGKKWMAVLFAIFATVAVIGTGLLVQVNSMASAVESIWSIDPWTSGIVIAVVTGLVIIGGVRSIGHVASVLVPLMAIFYLGGGCIILAMNYDKIPAAFMSILTSAFDPGAGVGAATGMGLMAVIQMGVSRSVFSNEAGLGVSSIAAAAAKTDSPGRQGMITMTGALLSTVIVCTVTGLVLAVTGVLDRPDLAGYNGATIAIEAFSSSFSGGGYIVSIGLLLFAFSTVIAWAYYGEKCFEYLFGERSVLFYRIIFTLLVIPGAAIEMGMAWSIADIANGLMAIPNLVALVALSGVVVEETNKFIELIKKEG
jgi:AGCS family alanine or glycine:cation symporter